MTTILKRTISGALAAATLGLTVAATPASAGYWGPGWGWHHHGGWGGGAVAAGVIGGLALGAIAANSAYPGGYGGYGGYYPAYPAYGYGGYGGCYIQRQPVYDPYGNFIGYHRVRFCH